MSSPKQKHQATSPNLPLTDTTINEDEVGLYSNFSTNTLVLNCGCTKNNIIDQVRLAKLFSIVIINFFLKETSTTPTSNIINPIIEEEIIINTEVIKKETHSPPAENRYQYTAAAPPAMPIMGYAPTYPAQQQVETASYGTAMPTYQTTVSDRIASESLATQNLT